MKKAASLFAILCLSSVSINNFAAKAQNEISPAYDMQNEISPAKSFNLPDYKIDNKLLDNKLLDNRVFDNKISSTD